MFKNLIKATTVASLFMAGTVFAMDYAFSIPSVYKSYSTNQCVKVENYPSMFFGETNFSCENMPSKFDLVWTN